MLRILIVTVAAAAGLGAGWLALEATSRPEAAPEVVRVTVPTVEILAPANDIRRGARLSGPLLAWAPWPEDRVNPGMILREKEPEAIETLAGRVLRSNVYAGEPLRREHIARGDGGFLSMVLQPGTRAVGIKIADDKTAGGFILPNDRVDVLHTVIRDIDGDGDATGATRTILTNVRVLAIGQTSFDNAVLVGADKDGREDGAARAPGPEDDGEGTTISGKTATLEVTARQAEVLLAAAASGQLALALRASDDFGLSDVGDLSTIEGERPTPAPAPPPGTSPLVPPPGARPAPSPASPAGTPAAVMPGLAADTAARRIRIIASGNARMVEPETEGAKPDGAS